MFLLDRLEPGNMHDVLHAAGHQIQLTLWPEQFIISPDPAPPSPGPSPRPAATGDLLIVAALPDPVGTDRGHETITLLNTTAAAIDLTGWTLTDAAGGRQQLNGSITGGAVQQVTAAGAVQLGNQGDSLVLVDANGVTIDHVAYTTAQVRAGRTICFGR